MNRWTWTPPEWMQSKNLDRGSALEKAVLATKCVVMAFTAAIVLRGFHPMHWLLLFGFAAFAAVVYFWHRGGRW